MLVSYNWLQEYFDGNLPTAKVVADKLVTHAYEIERVTQQDDDFVIDIDVLPNRGADSLSHNGIARELGVIFDLKPNIPQHLIQTVAGLEDLSIKLNVDNNLVPRINKMIVKGVKINPSPTWLQKRLEVLGQKPIHNVVDVTNLIMLETGQPIHAFDFDNLAGETKEMTLRFARDGEGLDLLTYGPRQLTNQSLVWADGDIALDLAGIKGGANSGVSVTTTNIILSACAFDAVQIRSTRQREKVYSDAAKRFEQNITAENTLLAISRAAELIQDIAGGKYSEVIDIYPVKAERTQASVDLPYLNAILGTDMSAEEVESILNRYKHASFEWSKADGVYTMIAPFERKDINLTHDVIEEIGRMYGYDNITSTIPTTDDFSPQVDRNQYVNWLVKKYLVNQGWSEVFNYIMGESGSVKIANSLVEGMEYVRSDMTESLRKNLEHNIKYADLLGLSQIKVFELNKVFNKSGEHWALGLAVKNTKSFKKPSDRGTVESIIELISDELGINKDDWKIREVSVSTQNNPSGTGVVAELNLELATADTDLPDTYDDVIVRPAETQTYKPISSFPFVSRDISVWVNQGGSQEHLEGLISAINENLHSYYLVDEFTKDGKTSLLYRIIFQASDRTLTDEEVNQAMEGLYQSLGENYELR